MADVEYYRNRAKVRLFILVGVIALGALFYWYFIRDGLQKIAAIENSAENFAAQEIQKNVSTPPPLIGATPTSTADGKPLPGGTYALTRSGVIADTNEQRKENGALPPLAEDATLDGIAQSRLNDMFAKQYFAHVSPASSSAQTVAAAVGYQYLALGENLALGDFAGDTGVVTAWMNSPGHRANILDVHYTQIGVAVGEGNFHGEDTWIAVQIFGRPASDCPAVDAGLKAEIDASEAQVTQAQSQLQTMQAQMNAMQSNDSPAYGQEVASYNAAAGDYNDLVAQVKSEIAQYNSEVAVYNQCIGS